MGSGWALKSLKTHGKIDILAVGGHLDPKIAQDGAKLAPRGPKMAQDALKMAPRCPQDGPKRPQDGVRMGLKIIKNPREN